MAATVIQKKKMNKKINKSDQRLQLKAELFDAFLELVEDKYMGYIMNLAEEEPNISISRAKKILCK